jgi:hypothetical protein
MCDKATYIKYLHGCGTQYKDSNMYIIRNDSTTKSTEERALQKIAPPSRLNPNYKNPRAPKVGKVAQAKKPRTTPGKIDRKILEAILHGPH